MTASAGGYVLGVPQVPDATLRLAGGRTFEVREKKDEKGGRWTLNGNPLEGPILRHADILAGGVLEFSRPLH